MKHSRAFVSGGFLSLGLAALSAGDWPMMGGRPDRNMVSSETGLPREWAAGEAGAAKNVKWVAALGEVTYGAPVISRGRVFIGTNSRESATGKKGGVLKCLAENDGRLLWEAVHPKLAEAMEDDATIGVCSTPCVADDFVYYVSNRAELVCRKVGDGTEVWSLDLRSALGVTPNQASASSPLVAGDLVYVVTGQGTNPRSGKVKNPTAPSFIAVHRQTGKIAWQDNSPGAKILTGQWGSPGYGVVAGVPQVAFPGGDGWLYAFEAGSGKLLWKFNCKAHEKVLPGGEPETTFNLVAAPVYHGDSVLIAIGEPEAGGGPGALRCLDARQRGDVTATAQKWILGGEEFNDSISTVAVHEGLVYATDTAGFANCIELATGKRLWVHDLKAAVWGSPMVADGVVYVQTADGEVVMFATGREKKLIGKREPLPECAHGTPVAANGVLYLTGQKHLYALAGAK
jgi:outer membrane protein assembly factor BamB